MSTTALVRVLCWLFAVTLFFGSVLFLALSFDLVATPPNLPPTTDFVDQLVAGGDFHRQIWAVDLSSSLLYVGAFVVLILLARPFASLAPTRDPLGWVLVSALVTAGVLGAVSQLVYIGATQVTIDVAYCDCGYKVEEVIAQSWAARLIQGAVGWLTNGTGLFLAIGVAAAGSHLGGSLMPRGWRLLSWLTAAVLLVSVLVGVLGIDGQIGPLLIGLETGVLLPVWAVWVAFRISDRVGSGATALG